MTIRTSNKAEIDNFAALISWSKKTSPYLSKNAFIVKFYEQPNWTLTYSNNPKRNRSSSDDPILIVDDVYILSEVFDNTNGTKPLFCQSKNIVNSIQYAHLFAAMKSVMVEFTNSTI